MTRDHLRDRLEAFFADEPETLIAYLFGSHAVDRSHRESDVDIGILLDRELLPTPKERFESRLRLMTRLGGALGVVDVDLIVLNDTPPTLAREIVTNGRLIFCRDPELEHSFRRDVQLRAADLEPYLRRMRRLKLEALENL